ncbi:DUF1771-domain-containing protein [Xylariaceae sp. FL0594]|nr:DUF1771-domain-containing protein [Xylariaceae sp. FL0594]
MAVGIELDRYDERNLHRLGGAAFRNKPSQQDETQYDQLRQRARQEIDARRRCKEEADNLYHSDRAAAEQLREEARRHGSLADDYNKQASDLIFSINNSGHHDPDTIDLHGQFVVEAETILRERIREDQSRGKAHLHVIVGKGNHSVDHVQRLKPAVEQLCRDMGLQYATEENEGRIYVNLRGEAVTHMPPLPPSSAEYYGYGGNQHHHQQPYQQQHYGNHQQQQQYYPGQQQQQQQHYGGQTAEDEVEKLLVKLVKKFCCSVM